MLRPLRIVKEVCCWAIAIIYVLLLVLGWYMVGLTFFDRWYHDSLTIHKSLGMILLFLVFVRVLWIIFSSKLVKFLARIPLRSRYYRILFYFFMVVINITGYLISTSAGDPVEIFGLVNFPAFVALKNRALEAAVSIHYYLAYFSVVLIFVHLLIVHRPRVLKRLRGK